MLDEYLRRQDGVITLAQARRCGLSDDAVRRRVRSTHWRRCAPGVYFVDDRPFTDAARARVAVWGCGQAACLSGLGAAWWQGVIAQAPDIIEVTVPRNSHGRPRAGMRIRRRDLSQGDIVELRGVRVTTLALTVVEAAARPGGGARVMDTALQQHPDLRPLWRAHLTNKGRHGSPRARILLQAAGNGARSRAERVFIALLDNAGITGWVANYPVDGYLIDVAFPELLIAVEIDGWAFHHAGEVFEKDRRRQNRLTLLGWQVLRFTWRDLTERPETVITQLQLAISAR